MEIAPNIIDPFLPGHIPQGIFNLPRISGFQHKKAPFRFFLYVTSKRRFRKDLFQFLTKTLRFRKSVFSPTGTKTGRNGAVYWPVSCLFFLERQSCPGVPSAIFTNFRVRQLFLFIYYEKVVKIVIFGLILWKLWHTIGRQVRIKQIQQF
jgi:hypothetical protein